MEHLVLNSILEFVDEEVLHEVLVEILGAHPRSFHPLLYVPPQPLSVLSVDLRDFWIYKMSAVVYHEVGVPVLPDGEICAPTTTKPGRMYFQIRGISISLSLFSIIGATSWIMNMLERHSVPPDTQVWLSC